MNLSEFHAPAPSRPRRRRFDAAKASRLTSAWTRQVTAIDYDLNNDLRALVARARDLAKNDSYFRRWIQIFTNNVIGPRGIRLQARVPDDGGGFDHQAAQAVEDAFAAWGRRGSCDVTGKLSWRGAQTAFSDALARDGEALIVLHHSETTENAEGLQLQFLDSMSLDAELSRRADGGNEIVMGVEIDPNRRPVRYWVTADRRDPTAADLVAGRKHIAIDAADVIHAYIPEFAVQTRGFPPAAAAMKRLQMLNGYEEATLVSARLGASATGFFKRAADGSGYEGDDTESDGQAVIDAADPGAFHNLPVGVELDAWDPKQPQTQFNDFIKALLRGIAAGLGVSYNALANDLESVNFSSLRAGAIEDREVWKSKQSFVCEAFCDPVFDAWLARSRLVSSISIDGNPMREGREILASWRPRRWPWVQPLDEIRAHEIGIKEGLISRSQIIRDSGEDPDEVWREKAAEDERLAELGIEVGEPPPVMPAPAENFDDAELDDDRRLRVAT